MIKALAIRAADTEDLLAEAPEYHNKFIDSLFKYVKIRSDIASVEAARQGCRVPMVYLLKSKTRQKWWVLSLAGQLNSEQLHVPSFKNAKYHSLSEVYSHGGFLIEFYQRAL